MREKPQVLAREIVASSRLFRVEELQLRFSNGLSSFLDVLDAQRALFTTQQATIVVQAAQQQNLVTLYRVLGGGWKDAVN